MLLINNKKDLDGKPIVATIGFFDGVHLGHQFLINQVKYYAKKTGLLSAVITFPVDPRKILEKNFEPKLLCSYNEKIDRLSMTNIDCCFTLDFTLEMSQFTAKKFMKDILKDKLNVDSLIIGYDHKFGYNRKDSLTEYKLYGKELDINIVEAEEFQGEHISSSHIRSLLANGSVSKAADLLSYNYKLSGKVVEGLKIGRTIGFPTANIEISDKYKVVPSFGVYAVFIYIDNIKYNGMLYIGKRPTINKADNISIEVNIFDFDADIYNKNITVEFLEFVRHDKKFNNINELKKQIDIDKNNILYIISNYNNLIYS